MSDDGTAVRWLDPADGRDGDLVHRLTDLVNTVYDTAESGLWAAGAVRTTGAELAAWIAAGEIAVAVRGGRIVGCVRVHDVVPDVGGFGVLVADPERRNTGIGRALVDFAELAALERGRPTMQLELLLPRTFAHPVKEFLRAWYGRRGYRAVHATSVAAAHPHLAPMLATECDLVVFRKPLRPAGARAAPLNGAPGTPYRRSLRSPRPSSSVLST